ncbi:MAG: phosphonate ABC transporter, permease protein PhnE [Longimicrobiales bacterium]
MPVSTSDGAPTWRRRTAPEQWVRFGIAFVVAVAFVTAWARISADTTWPFVLDSGIQMRDLLGRMSPPEAPYARALVEPLIDTLHIATLGTALGIVIALPVAFLAASTTTPSRLLVRPWALLLLVTSRSVNSIIWALILVVLLGPGLTAGILAIALRSVGFVGKLVYEAIEEAPELPVTAMTTTGAGRAQALVYGLVPQILPTVAGVSVYRWEINIREATILGIVGAGGLGLALQSSIDALAWSRVSVVLLVILATVVVAEWVSAKVRAGLS